MDRCALIQAISYGPLASSKLSEAQASNLQQELHLLRQLRLLLPLNELEDGSLEATVNLDRPMYLY